MRNGSMPRYVYPRNKTVCMYCMYSSSASRRLWAMGKFKGVVVLGGEEKQRRQSEEVVSPYHCSEVGVQVHNKSC